MSKMGETRLKSRQHGRFFDLIKSIEEPLRNGEKVFFAGVANPCMMKTRIKNITGLEVDYEDVQHTPNFNWYANMLGHSSKPVLSGYNFFVP